MVMEDYGGLRATGSNPPQDEGFLSNLFKSFGRIDLSKTADKFAEIPKALAPLRQFDPQFSIPTFDMQIDPFNMGRMGSTGMSAQYGQPIEYLKGSALIPFGELGLYGDQMSPTEAGVSIGSELLPEGIGPIFKGAFPIVAKQLGKSRFTDVKPSDEEIISVIKNPETANLFTTPMTETRKDVLGSNTQSGKFFVTGNARANERANELTADFAFDEGLEPNFADPPLPAVGQPSRLLRTYTVYDNRNPDLPLYDIDVKAGWNPQVRNRAYKGFSNWAKRKGIDVDEIPPSMFYKNQRPMNADFNAVLQEGSGRSKIDPFGDRLKYTSRVDETGAIRDVPIEREVPVDEWEQFANRLSGGNRKEKIQDFNDVMETLSSQTGASQLYGSRISGAKRLKEDATQIFESKQIKKNVGKRAMREGTMASESSFISPGYIAEARPEHQRIMIDYWKDVLTNKNMPDMSNRAKYYSLKNSVGDLSTKKGYPKTIIKSDLENTYFYEALKELAQPDMSSSTGFSKDFANVIENINSLDMQISEYDKNLINSILPAKSMRDRVIKLTPPERIEPASLPLNPTESVYSPRRSQTPIQPDESPQDALRRLLQQGIN